MNEMFESNIKYVFYFSVLNKLDICKLKCLLKFIEPELS